MGELRLHALSITEIRDMFGASPPLAATLRQLAGERFRVAPPEHRARGLLSKLGPLLKRSPSDAPVFPDGMPLPSDWENLIAGRFVAPDRIDVSWLVLDTWIDALDWSTLTAELSPGELDAFDFALTRAGLAPRFGLHNLISGAPQLGIRPATDMRVGYSKNAHVRATAQELAAVLDDVDDEHRDLATRVQRFLAQFDDWTAQAREQGRPEPDLFVVWWQQARG